MLCSVKPHELSIPFLRLPQVTFGGPQLVDARLLAAARILFAQSQAEVEVSKTQRPDQGVLWHRLLLLGARSSRVWRPGGASWVGLRWR